MIQFIDAYVRDRVSMCNYIMAGPAFVVAKKIFITETAIFSQCGND